MNSADAEMKQTAQTVLSQPDVLLVAAVRKADARTAMLLLESAGLPHKDHLASGADQGTALVSQSTVGGLDQVSDWMRENPTGHLLMFIPDPVTEVAEALSDGVRPEAASQACTQNAEQVLAFVRAVGRRRISVFLADAVHNDSQAFLRTLSERLQLTLVYRPGGRDGDEDELNRSEGTRAETKAHPRAIFRLMAENAIGQRRALRMQLAELLALAVPVTRDQVSTLSAIEEVFDEYQMIVSESDDPLRQLTKKKRMDFAKQLAPVERACDQAAFQQNDEQYQVVQQQNKQLLEENDFLLQQLHHMQVELERYHLRSVGDSNADRTMLEARMQALLNSKSWTFTRPLRVLLGVLTGNKAQF